MTRGASRRAEHARPSTNGVRPGAAKAVDIHQLIGALARIKVWELAKLGELSVERLIAKVVRASKLPSIPVPGLVARHRQKERSTVRKVVAPSAGWMPPPKPPALGALPGRITLVELDALVDYWALSVTLHTYAWNVSQAAARLGIARRSLRHHWRKVRKLSPEAVAATHRGGSTSLPPLPAPPSLAKMLADGVKLPDIRSSARRWLVTCTVELKSGNRTHAAETLGTSRRSIRAHLAAYVAAHDARGASSATATSSAAQRTREQSDAAAGGGG